MSELKMPKQCEYCTIHLLGERCTVFDAWLLNKEHKELDGDKCKQFIDDRKGGDTE